MKLKVPLIVAPMAGGPSTVELVAAACEAGALGAIGAAYFSASAIVDFVDNVRARTSRPFAINLFIPHPLPNLSSAQIDRAIVATQSFRNQFGLPTPRLEPPFEENFDQQFEAILKLRPNVFSFVFGLLKTDYIVAAKRSGIVLIGTATTLEEAKALQDSGVDAVTLQGVEAGGHRGIFDPTSPDPQVSIWDLLEQCRGRLQIPCIAAGGLMNAADIRRALSHGAQAVQLGTAFLACQEAGTSQPYREILLRTPERKTRLTRAFSGRLARGIENRFLIELEKNPDAILPFQAQNKFTRDIRAASTKANSSDCLSLWAGTGKGPLWTGSTAKLIEQLFSF